LLIEFSTHPVSKILDTELFEIDDLNKLQIMLIQSAAEKQAIMKTTINN